jgi:hypothetical protein
MLLQKIVQIARFFAPRTDVVLCEDPLTQMVPPTPYPPALANLE